MRNVSFTGHRDIRSDELKDILSDTIRMLINNGADMFFAGGAAGFDMLAAQTVISLKSEYPWITLKLILPCPPEEQSAMFPAEVRDEYYDILLSADGKECISPHYVNGCMKARNQRLIDLADICVCFYDAENRSVSGTGQTVRMAQKKGIRVINLYGI